MLGALVARPLTAQGPGFQLAHLFTDPSGNAYRLDWSSHLLGPLGVAPLASVIDSRSPLGNLWEVGLDLSLFRSGRPGFYAVGGIEGGLATQGSKTFRGAWSAGLGYEVFPFGGVSLAAEGRYRQIGPGNFGGLQLGVRLGLDRGSRHGGGGAATPATTGGGAGPAESPDVADIRADLGANGVPEGRATLIADVVQTALDVMGMPYRWGDEGEEGFDCSGLIRYAFGKHGISLPRRSSDQAREGGQVARSLDSLRAGDILTFSTQGRGVSHVGLYVGGGKFIHSASQGVQLSVLSPDDVSGRWWYRRWVGARRVVR
jgi:murein DD-endopeptidase / murein LD-carboxypeptidase